MLLLFQYYYMAVQHGFYRNTLEMKLQRFINKSMRKICNKHYKVGSNQKLLTNTEIQKLTKMPSIKKYTYEKQITLVWTYHAYTERKNYVQNNIFISLR